MNNDLLKKDRVFQVSEFNEFIYKYLGKVGEVVVEGDVKTEHRRSHRGPGNGS